MASIVSKVKDSLKKESESPSELSQRFSGVEGFFGRSLTGNGTFSWGLLLLAAFGIYAVVNLVMVVLALF